MRHEQHTHENDRATGEPDHHGHTGASNAAENAFARDSSALPKSAHALATNNAHNERNNPMAEQNIARYVPADTGTSYWGPGDRYIFLVTGAQSDGAYFIMEAIVPPGGGPPAHIHHREQESFYVLEGTLDVRMGEEVVQASAGDFVHIPKGVVHSFRNTGDGLARQLVICSPSGLERFFEETLEEVADRSAPTPDNTASVVPRYLAAAPRHGLEFV
jgi:mannose-6-phosphate isomerase-like protein (cupin superfamily)